MPAARSATMTSTPGHDVPFRRQVVDDRAALDQVGTLTHRQRGERDQAERAFRHDEHPRCIAEVRRDAIPDLPPQCRAGGPRRLRCSRRRRGAGYVGTPLRDQRIDALHGPDRYGDSGLPGAQHERQIRRHGPGRRAQGRGGRGTGCRRAGRPVVAYERQQRGVGGQCPQHLLDSDLGGLRSARNAALSAASACSAASLSARARSTRAVYCWRSSCRPPDEQIGQPLLSCDHGRSILPAPSSVAPGALRRAAISSRTRARLRTIPSTATGQHPAWIRQREDHVRASGAGGRILEGLPFWQRPEHQMQVITARGFGPGSAAASAPSPSPSPASAVARPVCVSA